MAYDKNEALRPHVAQRETPERLQAFAQRIIAALAAA